MKYVLTMCLQVILLTCYAQEDLRRIYAFEDVKPAYVSILDTTTQVKLDLEEKFICSSYVELINDVKTPTVLQNKECTLKNILPNEYRTYYFKNYISFQKITLDCIQTVDVFYKNGRINRVESETVDFKGNRIYKFFQAE